ncbi:MAG: HAD family phosphatase [Anaerolineales bacterium]|jgi:putative hydrolase of the HAD superfamily
MKTGTAVSTLFLDIGGVLLTNGWDRTMRQKAADVFGLDSHEMDERHHLTFDTYEEGKLSLDDYLDRLVFYKERPFSKQEFETFMFNQSQPIPEMISLIKSLKTQHGLRTVAVSNEGRELTVFRIKQFNLREMIDVFIASSFVHYRKPDKDIYHIALDISQATPEEVAYIDDRPMFVDVAGDLGIHGIVHSDFESTRKALEALGLSDGPSK